MSHNTNAAGQPDRRDLANAIRALSMDAVQAANSGHPGAPMGMADIAEVLWRDYLKHNPANPRWANRDRFVLSNGHGSMLLYSLLHLTGYEVSIDELKNFRQFGQRTAGHPEYKPEMGIETTTGPLGQGITNAVGMALAEKILAAEFNRDEFPIVDHRTWVSPVRLFFGWNGKRHHFGHGRPAALCVLGLGENEVELGQCLYRTLDALCGIGHQPRELQQDPLYLALFGQLHFAPTVVELYRGQGLDKRRGPAG